MKLKFINLLLAAFLLIGSAQALTSCKDTDEDLYAQLRDDNLSLQKKFEADLNVLKAQISALETLTGSLQTQITNLETKLGDYAKKSDLDDYVKKAEFNNLVDQYISAVSAYTNLKGVLDDLKQAQTDITNLKSDYSTLSQNYVTLESRLSQLETTLANYSTLVSDVETLKNFMQTTTTDITNINTEINNINTALTTLNSFMNEWSPKLGTIEQTATDALAHANQNAADIAALTTTYQQLQQMIIDNQNATDAQIQALQGTINTLEQNMQTILDDYMTKGDVDQAITDAIAGLATEDALETLAAALRQEAQENLDAVELRLQQQINNIITRLNGLDTSIGEINDKIEALDNKITEFINNYQGDLSNISGDLSQLQQNIESELGVINGNIEQQTTDIAQNAADILTNKNAIEALSKSLDSVIVRIFNLENRITSIVIQGVESPVLGYLKTPFGIESNFFLNYMGETDHKVNFPNFYFDGVEYDGELVITDKDIEIIGANTEGALTFNSGDVLFYDADGNLGTIYLTLNPSNIDLTGKTFTVVNSQDKNTEIELKNLRPSNVELTHGYSRTIPTSPNGFYQADVTVAVDKVPTLRVVVDNELKAAAKKVLVDLRNRTASASSLMALGNAVYNQFNGFLPALGIKAAWEESDGAETPTVKKQSVYSNYGMAAAAFKPLSYGFLYGRSFRQIHLPDLSGILDDYKFNFSENGLNIEFKPITINGVNVNFSLSITPEIGDIDLGSISTTTNVVIDDFPVGIDDDGNLITEQKTIPVDVAIDLNNSDLASNLSSAIEEALQNALSGLDDEINGQLQGVIDSLILQIQGQVNDMMSSLETQVNTSLSDILENLQNQVNGKIDMISNKLTNNALYRRLEALINKFNGVLADPNHYLQPVLLYSMQGQSFGMFSQSKALPSQFTGSGSAVMLTPTTYTGEIVTPAFKKFVAVTNVFKSDDYSVNAQAGDAKCKALADAANGLEFMNEVVPGERRTIPFSYEGGEGYTYEIVYQALDYAGVTSTAKYYVSIKK